METFEYPRHVIEERESLPPSINYKSIALQIIQPSPLLTPFLSAQGNTLSRKFYTKISF